MIAIIVAVTVLMIGVSAFLWVRQSSAREPVDVANPIVVLDESWPSNQAAQEVEFWKIIQATGLGDGGEEVQSNELRSQLNELHPNDLAKFIGVLDRLMYKTYSWDLWGAAYTIRGGASDDSFEDFRKWLISNGSDFFNQAIDNPDKLAELIDSDYEGDATFEEFSYIPMEIWSEKTAKKSTDLPKDKAALYPSQPFGEPFEENEGHLARRYPKLWERFGKHPLG